MKFKNIIPFDGLDFIKLYSDINVVKQQLENVDINYTEEIYDNSDCDINFNWHVLKIEDSIMLFFLEGNNKLWKIYIYGNCKAKLPNDICVCMSMKEALSISENFEYKEFEEVFVTDKGYWIEDYPLNDTVYSISIAVKETCNKDFFECKW